MVEFRCPGCGKNLKLPQSYAGQTTECPRRGPNYASIAASRSPAPR